MTTGTTFYREIGRKAVVAVIPEKIKGMIDELSNEISCSRQEIYNDICNDYFSNRSKYKVDLDISDDGKPVTIYLPKKLHKNMSLLAMKMDSNLKALVSSIISSYFRDRSSLVGKREKLFGRNKEGTS